MRIWQHFRAFRKEISSQNETDEVMYGNRPFRVFIVTMLGFYYFASIILPLHVWHYSLDWSANRVNYAKSKLCEE